MTTAETQVWRVVCEGGEVREVAAVYAAEVSAWAATGEATLAMGDVVRAINATARRAVMSYAMRAHWPVVEIVAPGVLTAAERLAQVTAARDAAVAACDALVTAVRAECASVADAAYAEAKRRNDVMGDRRDWDGCTESGAAMDAAAGIARRIRSTTGAPADVVRADVVREYLAAEDAWQASDDAQAATATCDAARAALDAALAPGGGR